MKVAFFGTSDRSIPILESLNKHFELVLCITKTNTKVGRKQEIRIPAVKKWADENKVACTQIANLKEEKETIITKLKESKAQLGVVADFGFIITKDVIDTPPLGLINTHFSLLPKYRGACPIQFAILHGEQKTGITFYLMDENMDTGKIITQFEYKIVGTETAGELYKALFELAATKLPKVLKDYEKENLVPQAQDETQATYTYSKSHPKRTCIFKEDAKIDWSDSPIQIERQIRAYNPWPICWTTLGELEKGLELFLKPKKDTNLKVKIHKAKLADEKLQIEELQVEGKTKMLWKDFTNGYLDSTTS